MTITKVTTVTTKGHWPVAPAGLTVGQVRDIAGELARAGVSASARLVLDSSGLRLEHVVDDTPQAEEVLDR